jgi:hypothetical protein
MRKAAVVAALLSSLLASVASGQSGARNGLYENCVSQCKANQAQADRFCNDQYSEKVAAIEGSALISADEKEREKSEQKDNLRACLASNRSPQSLAASRQCYDSCGPAPGASDDIETYCRKYASVPEQACINDTHDAAQCHSNYLNDFQACMRSKSRNY